MLEYKEGEFYKCHADNVNEIVKNGKLIGYKVVKPERKLTILLFLNDDYKAEEMIVFPSHRLFAHEVKPVFVNNCFVVVK